MSVNVTPWLYRQHHATLVIFRALPAGHMLCAVPALRALRNALPASRIALVGLPGADRFASRFADYIDEFIAFPGHPALPEQQVRQHELADFYAGMRARRFDIALQMHGNGEAGNLIARAFGARRLAGFGDRKGDDGEHFMPFPQAGAEQLRLLALTTGLGAPPCGAALEFPVTEADERELGASGLAAGLGDGHFICIHPGAHGAGQGWPPARFAQVADKLAAESGARIVLTGLDGEAPLAAAVAQAMRAPAILAAGPVSLGAMAALMSRARLLVCNNTGVSHVAAGLGVPSVVVFGEADMRRWAPLDRDRHRCLWDPQGERAAEVIAHARALLRKAAAAT